MRILVDLTSLADNFSGIERFAACITYEMLKQSDDDYILVFKEKVYPLFDEFSSKKNVKIVVLQRCKKLVFNQFRLPIAINKEAADVYFFPAFPAPFFFFKRNAVSAIHDLGCWDCPSKNKRYMTLYFKIMYWKAALGKKRVVTVSEFSKHRIVEILKKDKSQVLVIYDGISDCFENFLYSEEEEARAKEEYGLPQSYILCLSTVEPRKNMRLLVEAYDELLCEKKVNIDLVLAGRKGWLVDDLLSNLNSETVKRIHFTGFVDDELLPYVYKNAKMFVFPSVYEGFGIPPLEAMSMEVPVICSDAASLPEICGEAAIYFKSGDISKLKQSILELLSLEDNAIELLKTKGIAQAKKYNWKIEAGKVLTYLHKEFAGESK